MMRDNPQGADLLKEARHVLTNIVMPELSSEARYQLLMAVRAIKLAERQLLSDNETEAHLADLFAEYQKTDTFENNSAHSLSNQIRNGNWDASLQVFDLLQEIADFKLKETGP